MRAFERARIADDDVATASQWELRSTIGAAAIAALYAVWMAYSFLVVNTAFAEMSSLSVTAAGTIGLAQIERLSLDQMVQKTDGAIVGTIVQAKVFRVDHPVDGPELYFTTLAIQGQSLATGQPLEVQVTFPGGFINESEGVWNSEAPTADEILSEADDAMYADKRAARRPARHLRSVE